jgi:hypothetical protein
MDNNIILLGLRRYLQRLIEDHLDGHGPIVVLRNIPGKVEATHVEIRDLILPITVRF